MIIDKRALMLGGAGLLASGCASVPRGGRPPQTISFESLVRQVKHDIGTYIFNHQNDPEIDPLGSACAGQVAFTIQKVKMTVTTVLDRTSSVSGGLKVPINLLTIDASALRSRTLSNTLTTSLTIWPLTAASDAEFENLGDAAQRLTAVPPASPEFTGTPINDVLDRLRTDLLSTSDTPPCFDFGNAPEKDGNTVKWAFSVSDKAQGGAKFSMLLFSAGAETSTTSTFANTIEATFIPAGIGFG